MALHENQDSDGDDSMQWRVTGCKGPGPRSMSLQCSMQFRSLVDQLVLEVQSGHRHVMFVDLEPGCLSSCIIGPFPSSSIYSPAAKYIFTSVTLCPDSIKIGRLNGVESRFIDICHA
jgi:hypothetical protein